MSTFTCSEVGAIAGYLSAASNTMVVGHLLGLLTQDIMYRLEPSKTKTICIGHSLGSHVCGFTGKTMTLDAIVGLDPAGPIFEDNSPYNRLNNTDARVVYALHLNAGILGIQKAIGDVDIYVNGGVNQPGCSGVSCSHAAFKLLSSIWKRRSKTDRCTLREKCPNKDVAKRELFEQNCINLRKGVEIGNLEKMIEGASDKSKNGTILFMDTNDKRNKVCKFSWV